MPKGLGLEGAGGSKIKFSEHVYVTYQIKGDDQYGRIYWIILPCNQTGDLGMGSKDQLPLDFFESVGICDGAPSNVFWFKNSK